MYFLLEFIVAADMQTVYAIKKGEEVWKTGNNHHSVFLDMECKKKIGTIPDNCEIVITNRWILNPLNVIVGKLATQTIRLFKLHADDAYVILNYNRKNETCLSLVYPSS